MPALLPEVVLKTTKSLFPNSQLRQTQQNAKTEIKDGVNQAQKTTKSSGDVDVKKKSVEDGSSFDRAGAKNIALKMVDAGETREKEAPSKGAQASIAGLNVADRQTPSIGKKLQKGIVAAMIGLTLFSATAPAFAQDLSSLDLNSTQTELVVKSDTITSLDSTAISPWESRLAFDVVDKSDHSPIVEKAIEQAFTRFETRIKNSLLPSGLDYAKNLDGNVGYDMFTGEGSATPAQEKAVKKAITGLFGDLPVAAFSDGAASTLTDFFTSKGISGDKLQAATLSDFGDAGGDLAKQMVDDLRHDHPATFYSIATVLAGGAGAAAYFQGSDALESIGLKPQVSAKVFKGTKLKLGASWDAKFTNPSVKLGATNVLDFKGPTRLTTDFTTYLSGSSAETMGVDAWKLSSTFHTDNNRAGVRVYASDAGVASHGIAQGLQVGGNAWLRADDFSVSAGTDYNFESDRFNARVSAEYAPTDNFSLGLYGSHDSAGDSQIGIGGVFRF